MTTPHAAARPALVPLASIGLSLTESRFVVTGDRSEHQIPISRMSTELEVLDYLWTVAGEYSEVTERRTAALGVDHQHEGIAA